MLSICTYKSWVFYGVDVGKYSSSRKLGVFQVKNMENCLNIVYSIHWIIMNFPTLNGEKIGGIPSFQTHSYVSQMFYPLVN